MEEWGLVCWSDECSVERGKDGLHDWVFWTPEQKWDREMVQEYDCKKNMSGQAFGTNQARPRLAQF